MGIAMAVYQCYVGAKARSSAGECKSALRREIGESIEVEEYELKWSRRKVNGSFTLTPKLKFHATRI